MIREELNAKKELLKSMMKCPHRILTDTIPVFSSAMDQDPLFTGKMCYALTLPEYNQIRDLEEAGVSFLLTSHYPEHREAGRVLFQALEPYRAYRVSDFIIHKMKSNRQVRGAVIDYLRSVEGNKRRFEGAVRRASSDLHRMYEFYHVRPNEIAQAVLFKNEPIPGEVDPISLIKSTEDPAEQARLIVEHKVPYTQATSLIKKMTPATWVALIEVMTVPEAVNARSSIEKAGILGDPQIREMYENKLKLSVTSKRVSASTLGERKSAHGVDERLTEIVKESQQKKVDSGARILEIADLYVDCSGSMHMAIEISKRVAPYIASLCDNPINVIGFNDVAFDIKTGKGTIEDYKVAFALIRANGSTCLGSALNRAITVHKRVPEIAVYVTDQMENRQPYLKDVYLKSAKDTRFIFINVSGTQGISHSVAQSLEQNGADVTEYMFTSTLDTPGWYVDLNNFSTLLTKGGYIQLVQKIMELQLPRRKK